VRSFYKDRAGRSAESRRGLFRSVGVDNIILQTDKSYVEPLIRFFRMRERRLSRQIVGWS